LEKQIFAEFVEHLSQEMEL